MKQNQTIESAIVTDTGGVDVNQSGKVATWGENGLSKGNS